MAAWGSRTSIQTHSRRWVAAPALGAATLALLLGTNTAGAIVARIAGHNYGVTPIRGVNGQSLPGAQRVPGSSGSFRATGPVPYDGLPGGGGPLEYHGGPVMHSVTTHVIYWDPSGEFTATTKGIIGKFFTDVALDKELASNVFAVAGQYKDGSGHAAYISSVGSEATDATAYPASGCVPPKGVDEGPYSRCLTDAQLQTQLSSYISAHSLPTGPTHQYFVLFPHKVVTCLPEEEGVLPCSNNFFCAYHSSINPGLPSEIVYSDIPFSLLDTTFVKGCQDDGNEALQHPNGDIAGTNESTRFADVALKYTSHEYIEASTDPLVNAYFDAHGLEIGDKCNGVTPDKSKDGIGYDANSFMPILGGSALNGTLFDQSINADSYYLQSEWDNAATACKMKPVALSEAKFTASPASGVVGTPVKFTGAATDIYAGLGFTWKFGDGSEGAGATPSHVYAAAGSYEVTMTPKDGLTGSTTAPVVHPLVVAAAAPTVETKGATSITQTSATLNASVNPNGGEVSECKLEYGTTTTYGSSAPCAPPPGSGNSPVAVSAAVTGLTANTTYHFRVSATNTVGTSKGSDEMLKTAPNPPTVETNAASAITQTSATLNASVNPNGGEVSECKLEYGTTTAYGSSAPCTPSSGSGSSPVAVSAAVTGLTANTTYHSRISATNLGGTSKGSDQTFATSATPAIAPVLTPVLTPVLPIVSTPNSNFSAHVAAVKPSNAITFSLTVSDPGTLTWLFTFQNGKFGVFASQHTKCKRGLVNLRGRCRPSTIVFARGSTIVAAAGTTSFTVKPSASALKALKNAFKHKKGLPVTEMFSYQSSRGAGPVSRTQSLIVKLSKR
jgi:PKD domain